MNDHDRTEDQIESKAVEASKKLIEEREKFMLKAIIIIALLLFFANTIFTLITNHAYHNNIVTTITKDTETQANKSAHQATEETIYDNYKKLHTIQRETAKHYKLILFVLILIFFGFCFLMIRGLLWEKLKPTSNQSTPEPSNHNQYLTTITAYKNTLLAILTVTLAISATTAILNWSGADKINQINSTLIQTHEIKNSLEKELRKQLKTAKSDSQKVLSTINYIAKIYSNIETSNEKLRPAVHFYTDDNDKLFTDKFTQYQNYATVKELLLTSNFKNLVDSSSKCNT